METISLEQVQDATLEALARIRDEARLLFLSEEAQRKEHENVLPTLFNFFKYQSERSQAVSLLISNGYPWDAEIVLRSFYETSLKILFVCSADSSIRGPLAHEFWTVLSSLTDRKRSIKSKFAEAVFDPTSIDARIFQFLRDPEMFHTEPMLNKEQRRAIEQKWSFAGIAEALSKRSLNGKPLENVKSLLHIYGVASQLLHADPAAFELMFDRDLRSENERKLLETSHACRILSDQVSLGFGCVEALRGMLVASFNDGTALKAACGNALAKAKIIPQAFYETQKNFYMMNDSSEVSEE